MKILIVDDDLVSREILRQTVASLGEHQIAVAEDGDAAWRLLDDVGRSFDLVFLDISMPPPDGHEILRRIRASPLLRSLQVVMCTASNDRTTVLASIQLGAQHYLVKPCSAEHVSAKLKQIERLRFPAGSVA